MRKRENRGCTEDVAGVAPSPKWNSHHCISTSAHSFDLVNIFIILCYSLNIYSSMLPISWVCCVHQWCVLPVYCT